MVKVRSDDKGNFLKNSEILRNGKEFMVFIPAGEGTSGWVNVAYVLRRSFGGKLWLLIWSRLVILRPFLIWQVSLLPIPLA